jgi:hypothetical protein
VVDLVMMRHLSLHEARMQATAAAHAACSCSAPHCEKRVAKSVRAAPAHGKLKPCNVAPDA